MKLKTLSILVMYASILIGCKKSTDSDVGPIDIGPIVNHTISAEQANKIAVLHSIFPEQLKKPAQVKINDLNNSLGVKRLPAKRIKSNFSFKYDQSLPSFYIINYEGGGFAIVSGDDRVDPVLAYSDKSTFPLEENAKYPSGLVDWLRGTDESVKVLRKQNAEQNKNVDMAWKDLDMKSQLTLGTLDYENFPPCTIEGSEYVHTTTIGPLLQTKWGQWNGFNDNLANMGCTSIDGRPPAGCVAVATAQIMKYYQYPTSIAWSSMDNIFGTSATAQLMASLGTHLGMDYNCEASGTETSNAATVLKNVYGYASATYNSYNYQTVLNDLKQGRPVILKGGKNGTKFWFFDVYEAGHAWVADGYVESDYYQCMFPEWPPAHEEVPWWQQTYGLVSFHMNWGWNGEYDGWFAFNGWNPNGYSFNYLPGMITNIRPGN